MENPEATGRCAALVLTSVLCQVVSKIISMCVIKTMHYTHVMLFLAFLYHVLKLIND